jgi:hypothetical protein
LNDERERGYNFTVWFFHADRLAPSGSSEPSLAAEVVNVNRFVVNIVEERSLLVATLPRVNVSQPNIVVPQGQLVCFSHDFVLFLVQFPVKTRYLWHFPNDIYFLKPGSNDNPILAFF